MASNWLDLMKSLSSEDKKPRHSPTSSMTKFTRFTIVTTRDSKRKPWALNVEMDPAHPNKITVMPLKQFWKENNKCFLYTYTNFCENVRYTPFWERESHLPVTVWQRNWYIFLQWLFSKKRAFDFISSIFFSSKSRERNLKSHRWGIISVFFASIGL